MSPANLTNLYVVRSVLQVDFDGYFQGYLLIYEEFFSILVYHYDIIRRLSYPNLPDFCHSSIYFYFIFKLSSKNHFIISVMLARLPVHSAVQAMQVPSATQEKRCKSRTKSYPVWLSYLQVRIFLFNKYHFFAYIADINECESGECTGFEKRCINVPGAFICDCISPRKRLSEDGSRCKSMYKISSQNQPFLSLLYFRIGNFMIIQWPKKNYNWRGGSHSYISVPQELQWGYNSEYKQLKTTITKQSYKERVTKFGNLQSCSFTIQHCKQQIQF